MARPIRCASLALALLGCLAGCRSRDEATARPVRAAATAPSANVAERPSLRREDVEMLLRAWLDAQNRGDFAAYETLYAARFTGVRRTRERAKNFDRAGWLEDRRRMFRRPMTVAASGLEIASIGDSAEVRFTQRWSSGRFTDEGPKRMLIVKQDGVLRIAIEEMLASMRLGDLAGSIARGVFFLHPTGRDGTLAILGPATNGMAVGKPRLLDAAEPYVALRDAGPGVPENARALVGTTLHAGGCDATVGSIAVASMVVPHFGTVQEWEDDDFDESTAPHPRTSAQIAEDVVALSEQDWLVAVLPPVCRGSSVATREPVSPRFVTPRSAPERTDAVLAALRALDIDLRESVAAYLEDAGEGPPDDDAIDAAFRAAVQIDEHDFGGTRIVAMQFRIGSDACHGDLELHLFEDRNGQLAHLGGSALDGADQLVRLFDLEGDGVPEVIYENIVHSAYELVRLGSRPVSITSYGYTFADCVC